jgi:hypothetical protein
VVNARLAIGACSALIGIAIGLLAGSWLRPDAPVTAAVVEDAAVTPDAALATQVAELARALDRERELRGALEIELAMIRESIAVAMASPETPADADATGDTDASAADADGDADAETQKRWFDEPALVASGVDERHAAWLHERFEALQMDELYLRDQAVREGWLRRPRYARQLRRLQAEAREEIGDEDYDRMLFAAGRNNRVLLEDVLSDSPAAAAGIQGGDVLLRYDGRAVFDIRDLVSSTASGEPGSTVSVDVLRGGEELRFYVERGPLGAKIRPERRPPAADR